MSEETRVAKKLDKGDVVLIDGVAHEVKKVVTDGKKTTLTLVGPGREFVRKVVKAKAEMTLDVEPPAQRAAREKLEERLNSTVKSAAREHRSKPKKDTDGGSWHEPTDKAEKRIADIMGGKLIAIETPDGTLCPPLDPSTIKSHLWIMHGLESTALSYEDLVKVHEDEHARADREPFFNLTIPHDHKNRRPAA